MRGQRACAGSCLLCHPQVCHVGVCYFTEEAGDTSTKPYVCLCLWQPPPSTSGEWAVGWFLFHTAACPVSLLRDCLEGVCGPVTPRPGKGPVRGVTVGPSGGRSGLGLAVSGKTVVTHSAG